MGVVGIVALMLYWFRAGDANIRSVWICSRNEAIGNVAVLLAALGVFDSGSAWPDLVVAAIMALLGIRGGCQIIAQAKAELKIDADEPEEVGRKTAGLASR